MPKPPGTSLQGTGTGTGTAPKSQAISVPAAGPDTTPPSAPKDFSAQTDDQGVSINLSWQPATDNSGNVNYRVEKSADQQDWQLLTENLSDTFYTDSDVKFGTHYYYRVRASDAAGNNSDYVTADTSTGTFNGNASPDNEIVLTDDRNHIQATLPAGALSDIASCAIASVAFKDINSAPTGYAVAGGPFQVLCKKEDSTVIRSFNKPVTIKWTLKVPKNITGALEYYGNDDKLYKLTITSHDGKTSTDTFTLDKGTTFVAIGKVKHSSPLATILGIIVVIIVIIGGVLGFLYWRYRRQQQSVYDDYMHKMRGV